MSDKHGFRFYQPVSPGVAFHHAQTPCLENPIPHQGLEVIPGIIIMSCTCFKLRFCPSTVQAVASYPISMVFKIYPPKPQGPTCPRAETMLRTFAVIRYIDRPSPACVLSLDFYQRQFNPLGSIRQSEQNHAYRTYYPPIAVADHPSSKPSKHGVYSGNVSAPRDSGWRFPNTMLRTYAAHSCMNAHPPAFLLSCKTLLPITLKPT